MEHVMEILGHAEVVLMKKIKAMKDGKPKYAASERLNEIRHAMAILKAHDELDEMFEENEDAILVEQFTQHPPQAKA
jgi:hypothetical protein